MPHQVQLHMGAIHRVLEICQTKGVYLSDGIKRAIFWLVELLSFEHLSLQRPQVGFKCFSHLRFMSSGQSHNFL